MIEGNAKKDRNNNNVRIALIGMSNIGKSRLARALSRLTDAAVYCVDDIIRERLGLKDMRAVSAWLGMPGSDGFQNREKRYLHLEEQALRAAPTQGAAILDTTGSFAHLSDSVRKYICDQFLVVYLKPDESDVNALISRYFSVPKPIIWSESFSWDGAGEFEVSARANYRNLLVHRARIYSEMADETIVIAADAAQNQSVSAQTLKLWKRSHNNISGRKV